jgi:nucleoside-diphosphate-sugar epimerase
MKVLILGATGATGRHVAHLLLQQQHQVVALVRDTKTLSVLESEFGNQLTQIKGTALTLSDAELSTLIADADGVVTCLGHNLTLKGIFGAPRMLVRDSIKRIVNLTSAVRSTPLKMVLMNSSGVRNKDQHEPISFMQHLVIGLLRALLPPHRDNEQAADYLRTLESSIQWAIVRPDALIDQDAVSEYDLHPAPIRSAIFDSGDVSRINVASLMSRLLTDSILWEKWKGKMPLVYNSAE